MTLMKEMGGGGVEGGHYRKHSYSILKLQYVWQTLTGYNMLK